MTKDQKPKRTLTSKEWELWKEALKGTTPLLLSKRNLKELTAALPQRPARRSSQQILPHKEKDYSKQNPLSQRNTEPQPHIQNNKGLRSEELFILLSRRHLRKLTYEQDLDLHGYTHDRAEQALNHFIKACYNQERKCVLIITGKGKNKEDHTKTLKEEVPRWLSSPKYTPYIYGIRPAQKHHGGQGAFYVFLKTKKKYS